MRRIPRLGSAAMMLTFLLAVSAEGRKGAIGPVEDVFSGVVNVTTASEGYLTFVTVAEYPGAPLNVAYAIQYQNPMSSIPNFHGIAKVTANRKSLAISSPDADLFFKFPSYERAVPRGAKAFDIIGISRYSWPAGASLARPTSHGDFVRQVPVMSAPPICSYSDCNCGGQGAQSCDCDAHSVSCYAPYEACCNATKAYCCAAPK